MPKFRVSIEESTVAAYTVTAKTASEAKRKAEGYYLRSCTFINTKPEEFSVPEREVYVDRED